MIKASSAGSRLGLVVALVLGATMPARAEGDHPQHPEAINNKDLPTHTQLTAALKAVVDVGGTNNAGFGLNMWATIVNRDGIVTAVTFSGNDRGDQWPGSRVISAQKANTANAFSLPHLALSTANLFSAVQPGGTLFGLQESNPVDTSVAYKGLSKNYGQTNDPMVGNKIGGINVFGGGLALYNNEGKLVGALGVSGDTSCTDHIIAWKIRHALNFDNVPGGVSPTGDDNIIHDITLDSHGHPVSAGGFGHPDLGDLEKSIAASLPTNYPIGPNP
ncbi:MAG TPA: heme-binding protein [Haliangiales bacterium]|nr:heme-binding protein [Haliangiales bacterium]